MECKSVLYLISENLYTKHALYFVNREILEREKKNRGVKSPGFDCPIDPETTISIAKIELINRKNNTSSEIDDLTIHSDNGNEGRDGTQECALSHFDDIPIYSTLLI